MQETSGQDVIKTPIRRDIRHEAKEQPRNRKGKLLCLLGLTGSVLALSTHWLSRAYLYFDFFNNLTLHYGLAAVAFTIGYFMPRGRVLTAIVVIVAGLLAIAFWPQYVSSKPAIVAEPAANERAIKLMTFNTWSVNKNWQGIVDEVRRVDPDVVTMLEFGRSKRKAFDALKKDYPHSAHCIDKAYCHVAIMSKLPISDVSSHAAWQGPTLMHARLGPEYGRVHIFGIHSTRPPFVRSQIKQMQHFAKFLGKFSEPKIVMGDFNSTPYATLLQNFSKHSRLERVTRLPSFPARFGPFPQVSIDHIFLSDGVRLLSTPRIGHSAGSDHYPAIADVAVKVK